MRNLIIERKKSFVGAVGSVTVCVADPNGTITIDKTRCTKLGRIKNGQTATFQISEAATRIYAIYDELSKDYCFDMYELPEGAADVRLSGKATYNPFGGNPFRFDNNNTPQAAQIRKKNTRRGTVVLIAAVLIGFLVGWMIADKPASDSTEPKTFTDSGMTVTLTEAFTRDSYDGFDISYSSDKVLLLAMRENFTDMEGFEELTLEEYAQLIISTNELNVPLETQNDLFTCSFTESVEGTSYQYYAYFYKTDDAFWMVQFAIQAVDAPECEPQIRQWAQTISFS